MRAVVEVEEDKRGRTCLVVTELPYQVNPDNLAERIADLVKEGKLAGIADIRDESSGAPACARHRAQARRRSPRWC
jgi:DNA gyrase subunit A